VDAQIILSYGCVVFLDIGCSSSVIFSSEKKLLLKVIVFKKAVSLHFQELTKQLLKYEQNL
jgi:hypothetical protein